MAAVDTSSAVLVVMTGIGTVAFAASGVLAAARAGMDWLGATVLALVVAVGGGTLRDLLAGNLPVAWIVEPWPVLVALATAVVALGLLRVRPTADPAEWTPYLVADAIGLSAFVILGTSVSLDRGLAPLLAVLLGVVTGVGGGVLRDVLTGTRPIVLVGQIYAVAGLAGALVLVALDAADLMPTLAVWLSMAVVFVVRLVAIRRDWHLPKASPATRDG